MGSRSTQARQRVAVFPGVIAKIAAKEVLMAIWRASHDGIIGLTFTA